MRVMKDSGVEWLGQVPEGWKIGRAKDAVVLHHGSDPQKEGDTPVYGSGETSFKTCGESKQGPTVLLGRKGTIGVPQYIEGSYWNVDTAFDAKPRSENYNLKFFYYYSSCVDCGSYQTQAAVPSMNQSAYYSIPMPLPPLEEQRRIADYLDERCASIDAAINAAKASIEDCKAYRASLIDCSISGAIFPEPSKREGRLPNLEAIPEQWECPHLNQICKHITDGSHNSPQIVEEGYPYVTATDVYGWKIDFAKTKKISGKDYEALVAQGCKPQKDDVLLVKDGATTGRTGYVSDDTDCVLLSSVAMLRAKDFVNPRYLRYMLDSSYLQNQILAAMAGSALPRITLNKLSHFRAILPPLADQCAIVSYLDERCAAIDAVIEKNQAIIDELAAYRKSLIYEVVTGKREV